MRATILRIRACRAPGTLRRLAAGVAGWLLLATVAAGVQAGEAPMREADWTLAIHGGAGTMPRAEITAEQEARYHAALRAALDAGAAVLARGGSALDAVEATVRVLEDDPLFNAGRGAVFTWDGRNELDASIMDGTTLAAGAVAGVQHVRNPISLARLVMERSRHVLLTGAGAEEFAIEQDVPLVPRSWFHTERRWQQLQRAREGDRRAQAHPDYFGTVGAVARDAAGRLAAATSTGGMTGKRWGRVGDSPLVGAGTWADGRVAVSATGDGEFFIRAGFARDVAARVEYGGRAPAAALRESIARVGELGGTGGAILVDADGRVAFEMNSEGMFRGQRDSRGTERIAIWRD